MGEYEWKTSKKKNIFLLWVVREEIPFGHVGTRRREMCLFENEVASCFAMFIDM